MFLPLTTGITYRLRGESHIGGGFATAGGYDGSAHWNFDLRVPEPTSAALFTIGILAAPAFATRRRKR